MFKQLMQKYPEESPGLIEQELGVTLKAAMLYPCNYHAWNYRYKIILPLINSPMFENEWKLMEDWTRANLKDTSGWHYMNRLLQHHPNLLYDERKRRLNLLELYGNQDTMVLWTSLRFIDACLMEAGEGEELGGGGGGELHELWCNAFQRSRDASPSEQWELKSWLRR